MDNTVPAIQKVIHFRELLSKERHPERRGELIDLLAAELAKLPESAQRSELLKTARYLAR
ncbi:hypothetical protein [Bradyrhizobium guangdongense]|nr:hypothetical protein [Bradyrhizobium guangdongense]